mmetsp:Transcript_7191/g.10034  ORF Transcript_7191/g.10034 Transcript_7191/m.10034 type:complete len:86 (+) Transcript_7191:16-273(+)
METSIALPESFYWAESNDDFSEVPKKRAWLMEDPTPLGKTTLLNLSMTRSQRKAVSTVLVLAKPGGSDSEYEAWTMFAYQTACQC